MDAAAARPSGYEITAETTRIDVKPSKASELVLHLAVTETHTWLGIGGRNARLRRPRRLGRDVEMLLAARSGPDYLQKADECRRLMVRATAQELRKDKVFHRLPTADMDAAVPRDIEVLVAERAAALPDACRCEVSFSIQVDFIYNEAAALLRACGNAGGDMAGMQRSTGSGGAAPPCAICLEEMAPGTEETKTTWLPGCAHGFHGGCIGRWFDKAATCPVCRRDKLQYLPPAYRDVRDRILSDPEGEC
ncbi:hypothetical protein HU200_009440 [Digitaria exilis]|uniref:RING-type E3 ubiquitin transferase n=1 Tax=Digitaria exilis TaxID=1010633 RepID=A0A835FL11_9POAL|nr:hypothetical protein HU200_009440 [Digitaria exilis]CAB3475331.1 unnamed protein product [Digitaria exilis]